MAKIERAQAAVNVEEIAAAATGGIMVARGDLGIEVPLAEVPVLQKRLIRTAGRQSKPVVTATQMLASMVTARRPTRAEVTDVANAIYDGTDAIMLSEETAVGDNPVEAVRVMDRIARATEPDLRYGEWLFSRTDQATQDVADSVAQSAVGAVYRLGLKALVVPTTSGRTARILSAHRPNVPVLAISPRLETVRRHEPPLRRHRGAGPAQRGHPRAARRLRRDRRQARRRPLRRADRDHRRAARPGTGDEPLRGPSGPVAGRAYGRARWDRAGTRGRGRRPGGWRKKRAAAWALTRGAAKEVPPGPGAQASTTPAPKFGVRGGAAAGAELADADDVRLRRAARVAVEPRFGEVEAFVAGGDDEERVGRRRQRPPHPARPPGNRLADVDHPYMERGRAPDRPRHQQRLAEARPVDVGEGDEAKRHPRAAADPRSTAATALP